MDCHPAIAFATAFLKVHRSGNGSCDVSTHYESPKDRLFAGQYGLLIYNFHPTAEAFSDSDPSEVGPAKPIVSATKLKPF